MCCCNNRNRCCRCGCWGCASGNSETSSVSALSGLSISNLSGTATDARQVYLTIPAFLWTADQDDDDTSCRRCHCC